MTALPQAVPAGRSPVRAAILDALAWSMDALAHITGDAARALRAAKQADQRHDQYADLIVLHARRTDDVRLLTLVTALQEADREEDALCYDRVPRVLSMAVGCLRRRNTVLDAVLSRRQPKRTDASQEGLFA